MKQASLKRPHRLAFLRKWWQLTIMMLAFLSATAQDSTRYVPINSYGVKYKRHVIDSIMLMPLYESPHVPYRAGAIKYRKSDSSFYKYTGTQWLKVQEGGTATNGIDTVYTQDDTVQVIVTPSETYYTFINRQPYTEVLNDSTIVIGGDTLEIKGGASGGGGGSGTVTNVATNNGTGITGGPITTTGTLANDTTLLSTRAWRQKGDDSVAGVVRQVIIDTAAAIRGDFPATPTFQQVTDAGQVTNDSVRMRTATVDSALYLAVRRGADSIGMAQRRGLIMYDSTSGSLLYRGESFWSYLSTLSNSLIPNRPNMRLIAGVLRVSVVGTSLVWNWIVDAEHDSIGFGSVSCDGANVILALANPADKIHTILAIPDESYAGYIDIGFSFQPTQALLRIRRRIGVTNAYIQGNGTTYAATGTVTPTYTSSTGNLLLEWVSGYTTPANGMAVTYTGKNGYLVEKEFSGFGGADKRYTVVDMFGNPVTIAPTSDDVIDIVTPDFAFVAINPCITNGSDWNSAVLGLAGSNIWVIGLIEFNNEWLFLLVLPTLLFRRKKFFNSIQQQIMVRKSETA